jgi:hypothetical protein
LAGNSRFFEQSENRVRRDCPPFIPEFSERNRGSSFSEWKWTAGSMSRLDGEVGWQTLNSRRTLGFPLPISWEMGQREESVTQCRWILWIGCAGLVMHQKSRCRVARKRSGPGRRLHDFRDRALKIHQRGRRGVGIEHLCVTIPAETAPVFRCICSGYRRRKSAWLLELPATSASAQRTPKRRHATGNGIRA